MKVYVGTTRGHGTGDWEAWVEHRPDEIEPLPHKVQYSPDGFAWGYGGSGPTELARCLLLDVVDDESLITHQLVIRFRQQWVEPLNIDRGWRISELAIRTWLANNLDPVGPSLARVDCRAADKHRMGQRCDVCGGVP